MSSRTALCHIKDWQRISLAECRSLQMEATEDCFGCDACSRLCVACRRPKPVCPEMDMCECCLKATLGREGPLTQTTPDWKTCIKCRKRAVYYAVYGLCLHCSVKEFTEIVITSVEVITLAPEPSGNGHAATLRETKPEVEFPINGDFAKLISGLSDVEQIIVTLHQRDAFPMSKIGEILGLSERMVLQMHNGSLQKIQKTLN